MSNGIELTVTEVTRRGVRLALSLPDGVMVFRGEIHDAIAAANADAARTTVDANDARVGDPSDRST